MYKKETGNDKQGKDAGNRTLCPYRNFSQAIIKLEHTVMQLKSQSVEAWQNEKHYSKQNNTSKNPVPRQKILKSVGQVKYEGQVRSQHLLFVQFSQ